MSRTSTLIFLGILIVLTPFSGLPIGFRTFITVILGVCVSSIGFMIRAHEARSMLLRTETPSLATGISEPEDFSSDSVPQEPHGISPV